MPGAFATGSRRAFAGDFHEAAQILQVRAESLRDFARGVVFEDEAGGLDLLRAAFGIVVRFVFLGISPFGVVSCCRRSTSRATWR